MSKKTKPKLNDKQKLFVKEYLIDLNATQAAIRAGYSEKTAYSQGQRLLKHVEVARLVKEGKDKCADKLEITQERVLREVAKLAFFNAADLFDEAGEPIPISSLPRDVSAVIGGLDVVTSGNAEVGLATVLKVKLADKAKNLELLMKHLGMFDKDNKLDLSGVIEVLTGVPDAED